MCKSGYLIPVILLCFLAQGNVQSASTNKSTCLIQPGAISGIKIGMTVKAAKQLLGSANFLRDEGMEGVQFISVKKDNAELLFIDANEGNDPKAINFSKKIAALGTFHKGCKTAKGVGPGTLVKDVEKLYGQVELIQQLGPEEKLRPSGQSIKFANQPQGLSFYVEDESGIFPDNSGQTRKYQPNAKISLIEALAIPKTSDNGIFKTILPKLQKKTKVPPRLPTYLNLEEETAPIYVTLETLTSVRYEIEIAFAPDCHTATACHHGTLTGEVIKKLPPLKGQRVKLSKNVTGYFVDAQCGTSCSDSILTWEQNGYRYSVGIKAGKKENLVKMANSAIAKT